MKIDADLMRQIAPKAKDAYIEAMRISVKRGDFEKYEINTPLRIAHFMAQIAHESAGFTALRENMNYSAKRIMEIFGTGKHSAGVSVKEAISLAGKGFDLAERVYGVGNPKKARELGNLNTGDGWKYRARGPMGITGKRNYERAAIVIGRQDIVNEPDNILNPDVMFISAFEFWKDHSLNLRADQNDIGFITETVNGGFNGLADRKAYFKRIYSLVSENSADDVWANSKPNTDIIKVQRALNDLGYSLKVDGKDGPKTQAAIRDFQRKAGVPVDGVVGPLTWAAVQSAQTRGTGRNPAPSAAEDNDTMASGAKITSIGVATEVIFSTARQVAEMPLDSAILRAIPPLLMLAGVALTIYPMLRNYRRGQ